MNRIIRTIMSLLFLLLGQMVWAQGGFDPGMPPEPQAPKLPLTVTCSPAAAGTQSGAGSYVEGTTVTIKTTPKQFYTFSHWTLNGEEYGTALSFQYTTGNTSANFVAVYTKDPTCVVTTKCEPAAAGSASGAGTYAIGSTVSVKTSGNAGYNFSHWTLNGEVYSTSQNLSYTAVEGTQNFVVVYDYDPTFDPALPAEPNMTVRSRLYLQSDPAGICTFNRTSGTYVNADEYVTLNITGINQGYDFIGWYQGDELISSSKSFNFMMTYSDATLTARFVETPPEPEQSFEPGDPSEPEIQGGDIHNYMMGDVNNDKSITAQDASLVLQAVAGKISFTADQIQAADVNHDGDITAQDASLILQYVAGKISW